MSEIKKPTEELSTTITCDVCSESFATPNLLLIHEILHLVPNQICPDEEPNETIEHITHEVLAQVFESVTFCEGVAELMRLVYFNENFPRNCTFCIDDPTKKKGAMVWNQKAKADSKQILKQKVKSLSGRLSRITRELINLLPTHEKIDWNLSECQQLNLEHFLNLEFEEDNDPKLRELLNYLKEYCFSKRDVAKGVWREKVI